MSKHLRRLLLCLALAASVVFSWNATKARYQKDSALDVWVLSVGQGESVFMREASGKKILFDGGPDSTVLSELAEVMPYWDKKLDLLILSHNHADHLAGMLLALESYEVEEVWISGAKASSGEFKEWEKALAETKVRATIVKSGYSRDFGTLSLSVLHPLTNQEGKTPKDQHDATLVVRAKYEATSILLTGDIDEKHEAALLRSCAPPACELDSDVLQVPHHGSKSGLSDEFLTAVSPAAGFIPVGIGNKYGHPSPDILNRLELAKIPYLRTDKNGRGHFILRADSLSYGAVRGSPPR